ncbi:hypothetical protein TWF481_006117 [Arthrobotrys musiformis]|uniref:Uncharacterized protein n=1 Tax=Arthrobotrys musiformis TaxID=47236 RepID=A0AAV9WFQ6_9PEZI
MEYIEYATGQCQSAAIATTQAITPVLSRLPDGTGQVAASSLALGAALSVGLPGAVAAFGFSSGGVASGSLAALWQSSIGNVAAGSVFAAVQSATMTSNLAYVGFGVGSITPITWASGDYLKKGFTSVKDTVSPGFQKLKLQAQGAMQGV